MSEKTNESPVETVTIIREDGSGYLFNQNQREDEYTDNNESPWRSLREAREERKVDAMETRERIRKAGFLP